MDILRKSWHSVSLQLLGGPDVGDESAESYAQAIRQRIENLELGSVIHLEGRRNLDEVTASLREADIFIAPFVETETGDKDGIPTSVLEAMASGLALVVTDAGDGILGTSSARGCVMRRLSPGHENLTPTSGPGATIAYRSDFRVAASGTSSRVERDLELGKPNIPTGQRMGAAKQGTSLPSPPLLKGSSR